MPVSYTHLDVYKRQILGEKFNGLMLNDLLKMYKNENRRDFSSLGREKTAVFFSISDTDRSKDRIISLFYTQALQELCNLSLIHISAFFLF